MNAFFLLVAKAGASMIMLSVLLSLALVVRVTALFGGATRKKGWNLAGQALTLGALCASAYSLLARGLEAGRAPLFSRFEFLLVLLLMVGVVSLWLERRQQVDGMALPAHVLLMLLVVLTFLWPDVDVPMPSPLLWTGGVVVRSICTIAFQASIGLASCCAVVLFRRESNKELYAPTLFWVRTALLCSLLALAAGTMTPATPLSGGLPWNADNAAFFAGALACAAVLHLKRSPEGDGRLFPVAVIGAWVLSFSIQLAMPWA